MMRFLLLSLLAMCLVTCADSGQSAGLVTTVAEFEEAVRAAGPGTTITLASGVWQDAELLLEGKGTEEAPIVLTAEEKGKVFLEGTSNLRLAGEYLHVEGLVFRNGHTPTTSVISFRKDREAAAYHSRLTECVIDNYNNPERQTQDYWISIYGQHNRVDHNHVVGKKNLGVTMIVGLDTEDSRANFHRIDHNYFGPRPTYGNNGGETLRIGTSHHALENSNTLVEANYFDRCNGEHEIISNKSCQNTYKHNTFYECTGTLTMRHGNETVVDGNVFIGNGKPSTGGIRVINETQTVTNNYHVGLTGYRFRGAFVMMNGVPNSPPNRYVPVTNSVVSNNVYVNCDHIQLGAGSDAERSVPPRSSRMAGNVFYHDSKTELFTVYDDIGGIAFADNVLNQGLQPPVREGFTEREIKLVENASGFVLPQFGESSEEFKISPEVATKENTGTSWYDKADRTVDLNSGKVTAVVPGINTLYEAVLASAPGDQLELTGGETYLLTKIVPISHPLTIRGTGSDEQPVIFFERMNALEIRDGGSLSLVNLTFDGSKSPDYAGNGAITTSKRAMLDNYKLFIEGCTFRNFVVNHSFDVLQVGKGTFADTISIQRSRFDNISGHIAALDKETDDVGAYNVEYLLMKDNVVTDLQGAALRLYRGGRDESTFGPFLEMENNVFSRVGYGKKNKYAAAVSLYGVQEIAVRNNLFTDAEAMKMHLVVGEPIVKVLNNNFYRTPAVEITGDQRYTISNSTALDPGLTAPDYRLPANSPLRNRGTDGGLMGVRD